MQVSSQLEVLRSQYKTLELKYQACVEEKQREELERTHSREEDDRRVRELKEKERTYTQQIDYLKTQVKEKETAIKRKEEQLEACALEKERIKSEMMMEMQKKLLEKDSQLLSELEKERNNYEKRLQERVHSLEQRMQLDVTKQHETRRDQESREEEFKKAIDELRLELDDKEREYQQLALKIEQDRIVFDADVKQKIADKENEANRHQQTKRELLSCQQQVSSFLPFCMYMYVDINVCILGFFFFRLILRRLSSRLFLTVLPFLSSWISCDSACASRWKLRFANRSRTSMRKLANARCSRTRIANLVGACNDINTSSLPPACNPWMLTCLFVQLFFSQRS